MKIELWRQSSTYGGEKRRIEGLVENPTEKDHLEDPDLDKILILKCIFGIGMGT